MIDVRLPFDLLLVELHLVNRSHCNVHLGLPGVVSVLELALNFALLSLTNGALRLLTRHFALAPGCVVDVA